MSDCWFPVAPITELPSRAHSPAMERAWQDLPDHPRAVAALFTGADSAEAVGGALADAERELAAGVLADAYRLSDEFTGAFGIPWVVARATFEHALTFAGRHPARLAGEGVITLPVSRFFERLGYGDGLAGAVGRPPRLPGRSPAQEAALLEPPPATPDAEAFAVGVTWRVNEVYGRAYDRGLRSGWAERCVDEVAPACRAAIQQAVRAAMVNPPATETEWPAALAGLHADLRDATALARLLGGPEHAAAIVACRRAARRAARRSWARHRVVTLAGGGIGMPPANGLAACARVFGARVRDTALSLADRMLARACWEETVCLFATHGIAPATLAACARMSTGADDAGVLDTVGTVDAVLRARPASSVRAAATRQVLRALTIPAPAGLLPGLPTAGIEHEPRARPARLPGPRAVARLASHVRDLRGLPPVLATELAQVRAAAMALADRGLFAHAAAGPIAALAAERLWAEVAGAGVPSDLLHPSRSAAPVGTRLAAPRDSASEPPSDPWVAACTQALTHAQRIWQEAGWLGRAAPDTARRVRAECELVVGGRPVDAEAAEDWVLAYRTETAHGGADAPDGRALRAGALVLDAALDQRAAREASDVVARHTLIGGPGGYCTPDAYARFADYAARAYPGAAADAATHAAFREAPRLAARIARRLPAEVAEWLAAEWAVIDLAAPSPTAARAS